MRATGLSPLAILRRGLPALAVYALLLQAFLAGAAPAKAFDPAAAPLCAEMTEASAPAHTPVHKGERECVCLASCTAAHAHALADGAGAPEMRAPEYPGTRIAIPSDVAADRARHRHGPEARAPPRG